MERNIKHKDTVPKHQFKYGIQIEEMQDLTLHIESEETVYDTTSAFLTNRKYRVI